jgi:hypothetical protein
MLFSKKRTLENKFVLNLYAETWLAHCKSYDIKHKKDMSIQGYLFKS